MLVLLLISCLVEQRFITNSILQLCQFTELRRRLSSHSREISSHSLHFLKCIRPKYSRCSQQETFWLKVFRTDSYCKQTGKDKSGIEGVLVYLCLMALWYSEESKSYLFDLMNFHCSFSDYIVNSASLCCSCLSSLPCFSLKAMKFFFGDYSPRKIKRFETHFIILVYEEVKGLFK